MDEIKICEFNLENLFISMDYYEGQDLCQMSELEWKSMALAQHQRRQKPLWQLWGLAKAILDIDAEVLMLVEVGGEESLAHFCHYFLEDQYEPYFVEGNSSRGIDLGFLVRSNSGFSAQALSNRDTPVEVTAWEGKYLTRLSRDVAELRLSDKDGVRLILLVVHLKSKISSPTDFKGKDVRTAEANALAGVYENLRKLMPSVPIVVGGDFNAELTSLELDRLTRTDLVDFHEILGTPEAERVSLVFFDYAGNPHPNILDYLLVSPHLRDRVIASKSGIYRYKGFYDIPDDLPGTQKQRFQMPSDHYPLVLAVTL